MNHPGTLLLYVEDTDRSATFFSKLFGAPVVEQSENFAMLVFPGGVNLGLWARHDVKPAPQGGVSGFELCVTLGSETEVDAALAEVRRIQAPVIQEPCHLDFGYTFLASSPDGHLIRVFSPAP